MFVWTFLWGLGQERFVSVRIAKESVDDGGFVVERMIDKKAKVCA